MGSKRRDMAVRGVHKRGTTAISDAHITDAYIPSHRHLAP